MKLSRPALFASLLAISFLAFGAMTWVLFQEQILTLWQLYLGLMR